MRCLTLLPVVTVGALTFGACASSSESTPGQPLHPRNAPVPCTEPRDSLINHVIDSEWIKLDYVQVEVDLDDLRGDTITIIPDDTVHGVHLTITPDPPPDTEIEVRFNRDACPKTGGKHYVQGANDTKHAERAFPWVFTQWRRAEFDASLLLTPEGEAGTRASGFVILSN